MTDAGITVPQTAAELRQAILDRHDSLSKRLQHVARYVLDHPDDMALQPLSVIATRSGTQPSAIVRFAKSLGFTGAGPMQRLLRDSLLANNAALGYGERVHQFTASVDQSVSERGVGSLIDEFTEADILALQNTRATVGEARELVEPLELDAVPLELREGARRGLGMHRAGGGPRDVGEVPEDAVEVDFVGAHEQVRQRVQTEVRVSRRGGGRIDVDGEGDRLDDDIASLVRPGRGLQRRDGGIQVVGVAEDGVREPGVEHRPVGGPCREAGSADASFVAHRPRLPAGPRVK